MAFPSPLDATGRQPLQVAVLGAGQAAFIQTCRSTLADKAGQAGEPDSLAVHLTACSQIHEASGAALCWLLAWEADATIAELQTLQALRRQLHAQNIAYQVLRGSLQERVAQAMQSLARSRPELGALLPRTGEVSRRPGRLSCDSCGDPDCEHQSFTELIARRQDGQDR